MCELLRRYYRLGKQLCLRNIRSENLHGKKLRNWFGILLLLFFAISFSQAVFSQDDVSLYGHRHLSTPLQEVPAPWVALEAHGTKWKTLNKTYSFDTGCLPTALESADFSFFHSAPEMKIEFSDGFHQVLSTSHEIRKKTARVIESQGVEYGERLNIIERRELGYDGFLKCTYNLIPKSSINVKKLYLEFELTYSEFNSYSRYMKYDFGRQRVDFTDLVDSTGSIDLDVGMLFTPALWIGGDHLGVEIVTETNVNWVLEDRSVAIEILKGGSTILVRYNLIDMPDGLVVDESTTYQIALFPTPSRPLDAQTKDLRMQSFNGKRPAYLSFCDGPVAGFMNWSVMPVRYPGLPSPDKGVQDRKRYMALVRNVQSQGMLAVPYSSLYILPSSHPVVSENADRWSTSSARRNPSWSERMGVEYPVLPVSYEDDSIVDFVIGEHLRTVEEFGTDGVYMDAASPYEHVRSTSQKGLREGDDDVLDYPMFSHRAFLQRFWEVLKEQNPDFLIIHHAPRIPKFASAYADVVVVGEAIHRLFYPDVNEGGRNLGHNPPVGPFSSRRSLHSYLPDYNGLPSSIREGLGRKGDGVRYMLLPQVVKKSVAEAGFGDELFSKLSLTAIELAREQELLLWYSRLNVAAVSRAGMGGLLPCQNG